jgi:TonB family protein
VSIPVLDLQSREAEVPPPVLDGELHLLLGDLNDDVSGYRRREAVWLSVIVHIVIILALIFAPKWMPASRAVIVPIHEKETTLYTPSQRTPKVTAPPTNKISDQSNRAQTRTPQPDRKTLRELADAKPPGPRQPVSPPVQQQPQQQTIQQAQAPPQGGSPVQPQPQPPQQTAKLEAPPEPKRNPFSVPSAGSSVDQAIHSAATTRVNPGTSFGGDYGSGIRPKVDTRGNMEILSDTRGVDFGPYMRRLHVTVEDHWYPLIPEIALPPVMKKGRVIIEFAIMKDGSIQGLRVVGTSGDTALDRAAYSALTNAVPLPKLPVEFSGEYLLIRAAFYYNPDKHEFE